MSPCGFESVQHPVLFTEDQNEDIREEVSELKSVCTPDIVKRFHQTSGIAGKMVLLQMIIQRDGPAYLIDDKSVEEYINEIYVQACFIQNWSVVRQGASLLGKSIASMAPCITSMLVCGKQVRLICLLVLLCFSSF